MNGAKRSFRCQMCEHIYDDVVCGKIKIKHSLFLSLAAFHEAT